MTLKKIIISFLMKILDFLKRTSNNLKQLIISIWTKICLYFKSVIMNLKYGVCFNYLKTKAKILTLVYFLKFNKFGIGKWFIILILSVASWFLVGKINISSIDENILKNYFISIGVLSGSVIAIVFTLITPALQEVINYLPARHIGRYLNGFAERFSYIGIVVISIYFLNVGFFYNNQLDEWKIKFLIASSIVLVGVIFIVIEWYYESIRRKMSPDRFINYLESKSLLELSKIEKNAKQIIKITNIKVSNKSDNKKTNNQLLAQIYNNSFQSHFKSIRNDANDLLEIAMKFSGKRDYVSSKMAITSALKITRAYLKIRKDNSFAFPDPQYLLATTSDSRDFLTPILEKLNNMGEIFVSENNRELAVYIVVIFYNLAVESSNTEFDDRQSDNPIFSQIEGYLGMYLKYAIKEKSLDVVFECAKSFKDLAVISIRKEYQSISYGLPDTIFNIAYFGIAEKYLFIADVCNDAYLNIIIEEVFKDYYNKINISKALEKIKNISFYINIAINSGLLSNDYSTKTSITYGYDKINYNILALFNSIFFTKNKIKNKEEMVSNFVSFQEDLYGTLRKLSEENKNSDTLLVDSIGRLLMSINETSIRILGFKKYANIHKELKNRISWFIHLPSFFIESSPNIYQSKGFTELVEFISKTGLSLFGKKSDDLKTESIKSMFLIVKKRLDSKVGGGHAFDEPRLMMHIAYMGILAIKYNKQKMVDDVKEKIIEFEKLYSNKYFSNIPKNISLEQLDPKPNQLFIEFLDFIKELKQFSYNSTRRSIMDYAEDKIKTMITEEDAVIFAEYIWEVKIN